MILRIYIFNLIVDITNGLLQDNTLMIIIIEQGVQIFIVENLLNKKRREGTYFIIQLDQFLALGFHFILKVEELQIIVTLHKSFISLRLCTLPFSIQYIQSQRDQHNQ